MRIEKSRMKIPPDHTESLGQCSGGGRRKREDSWEERKVREEGSIVKAQSSMLYRLGLKLTRGATKIYGTPFFS